MSRPTDAEIISVLRKAESVILEYAPKLKKRQTDTRRHMAWAALNASASCGDIAYRLTQPADDSTA